MSIKFTSPNREVALLIKVEPDGKDVSPEALHVAKQRLIDRVKLNMTITPMVEIVDMGELPRFEAKAKRVYRS